MTGNATIPYWVTAIIVIAFILWMREFGRLLNDLRRKDGAKK